MVNESDNSALVPKTPATLEKLEPGTKRVLSGMVADVLTLATKVQRRKPRIVVVDDEDWLFEIVERLIRSWFNEVTLLTFQNRDEAWQELLRADPDLLITDMNNDNTPQYLNFGMRFGMSGWKMLPLLGERKAKYPILVVSGSFLMEGVMDKAKQCAGSDLNISFLTKPFTTEQFNLELFRHFGPSDKRSARFRKSET